MTRPVWSVALALTAGITLPLLAGNWPQWRGPAGTGISPESGLPLHWSETEHVAWKCPLPEGDSTPVVWGNAVFATGQEGERLLLVRIDRDTGHVVWSREVGTGTMIQDIPKAKRQDRGFQKFHRLHNLASPSPVTDGERVVVHFGNGDLAAYDFAGKQIWKRNLQHDHGPYTIWWGHANSPVLVGDLVINACMQDSLTDLPGKTSAESYLVAHDKRTGELRWKTRRDAEATAEQWDSYTTPLLRTVHGRQELVVMGSNQLDAYDPATGKQLWVLPGLAGGRTVTGPTDGGELIFATRGLKKGMVAVRAEGSGRLPPTSIVWREAKGNADSSSPVVANGLLFWITDDGIAHCADTATGAIHWRERLSGDFKASLLAAGGRVYFVSTSGRCSVVAASPRFEKLADNVIDDQPIASPAAADGRLYLRGRKALYCIRN